MTQMAQELAGIPTTEWLSHPTSRESAFLRCKTRYRFNGAIYNSKELFIEAFHRLVATRFFGNLYDIKMYNVCYYERFNACIITYFAFFTDGHVLEFSVVETMRIVGNEKGGGLLV